LPSQSAAATPATAPPTTGPPPTESAAATATTVTLDPPTAEEFATDLATAQTEGDVEYLMARLHPAVIERYGTRQCRIHIRNDVAGQAVTWEIQGSAEPAPWDYASDGLTTTIDDVTIVTVLEPPDTEPRELHFAPSDGTWRWFTDCGTPA